MNRKSIYLIVLGIVLVISGVFVEVVTFTEKNKKETYRSLQKQMDFRQVVSDKFSDKYFTFEKVKIENASIYQLFKVNYNIKGKAGSFYIETFWQESEDDNLIKDADLLKLKKHTKLNFDRDQLVDFKIIGLGGFPSSPKQIFIIPAEKISSANISIDFIAQHCKDAVKENFFYDTENNVLK
ncbi:MAG: hypothetical protein PF489_03485 [Salinivirgaceae bacterium]|jgi:hypothetical protein|nr:hypothetical protein [Salinivirgaceae bacterium]